VEIMWNDTGKGQMSYRLQISFPIVMFSSTKLTSICQGSNSGVCLQSPSSVRLIHGAAVESELKLWTAS